MPTKEAHPPAETAPIAASLDPQESTTPVLPSYHEPSQPPAPSLEIVWRHSHWQRRRALVRSALEAVYDNCDRVRNFQACGSAAWVISDPNASERFKVSANYCHDRW